jgi:hypothetical protein
MKFASAMRASSVIVLLAMYRTSHGKRNVECKWDSDGKPQFVPDVRVSLTGQRAFAKVNHTDVVLERRAMTLYSHAVRDLLSNEHVMPIQNRKISLFSRIALSCLRAATSALTRGQITSTGIIFLFAGAYAGVLSNASAAAEPTGPVRSLIEMREQSVVVQKFDLSCGAAALATLLAFQFGDRVTEKEVTAGLIRRPEYIEHPELVRVRQGFSLLDLKRYASSRGYQGIGYGNLEMSDLIELAPIIVAVSPFGYNHFVIFRGMLGDKVVLADPAYGNRTMSREKFERLQIDFPDIGKVGFIITRNGTRAPPGDLALRASDFTALSGDQIRQILNF